MDWICRVIFGLIVPLGMASAVAQAQTYPSRPITIVVPFAAGGATDAIARIVGERMRAQLGQPVIIENVAGADGSIAQGRVARAAPDGYTISIGNIATNVFNGAVYQLKYDLFNDLEPIGLMVTAPALIVATKAFPPNDLNEMIAWLKVNPGKASAGVFAIWARLLAVQLQNTTGTQFQLVAYRGAGPAMQDMVAGHIQIMFDQAGNSLPQLSSGTIKAFAVAAKKRLALAANVPTTDEAGLPGFHMSIWHGLWAPKATPKAIIDKLNAAMTAALADPDARKQLGELGQEIAATEEQGSDHLRAFQKAEADKWWPVIKQANIKSQ